MILIPAIDIKDKNCVRLKMGNYNTVEKVAEDPIKTALSFKKANAEWIHIVDLDGAKDSKLKNSDVILDINKNCNINIEVGGGIRTIQSIDYYIKNGISRVILGSAAVKDQNLIEEAVRKYGEKIAVGIDAKDGKVAVEGWLDETDIDYIELSKRMESLGVKYLIFTDISKDGMLLGPNIEQLYELSKAVSCNLIASGGVSNLDDVKNLESLDLYGVICGKAIYTKDLDVHDTIEYLNNKQYESLSESKFFKKSKLTPAIVQDYNTNEVLMLAYMNKESLDKTIETGFTWFYSRSRQKLWNKGATSGNVQKVVSIYGDCDDDTILVKVLQTGNACHTGNRSCFFNRIK